MYRMLLLALLFVRLGVEASVFLSAGDTASIVVAITAASNARRTVITTTLHGCVCPNFSSNFHVKFQYHSAASVFQEARPLDLGS